MRLIRGALLLLPLLLAACSDSGQPNASYAPVYHSSLDPIVYDKMVHGDNLTLSDIAALNRAGVADDVTLRYLRHKRTVYHLNPQDIGQLRQAGVSREVVAFMIETSHDYSNYHMAAGSGFYIPYYDDYWGPPYPNYPDPSH